MADVPLSIAIGDYDRTHALICGGVPIDGVAPTFLTLSPEETFYRALLHEDFDVCELSLSSYAINLSRGASQYVAIPVFPSRAFRHTAFYVRTDSGINQLADLRGRRIGIPEYQLTACVWARAAMSQAGVKPSAARWVRGGIENPGRVEKVQLDLPADIQIEDAPPEHSLTTYLEAGGIDAILAPRPPSSFANRSPGIRWLFADPIQAAMDYFRATRVFPIMHVVAIHSKVIAQHRWLPATLLKAFSQAKLSATTRLADNSAPKVTLPFLEERVAQAQALLGADYWPYGLADNRKTLQTFLQEHHLQGLSKRLLTAEELFHPSTHGMFRI